MISLSLVSAWLWRDARSRNVSPWPFLVVTAVLGRAGPLLYLVLKPADAGECCAASARAS